MGYNGWMHNMRFKLTVDVRHDCSANISPGLLQDSNHLEGSHVVPPWVDDDRAASGGLRGGGGA